MTIVRSGTSLAGVGHRPVSTPLTRRAKLRELRLIDERRRNGRRVLVFLLVVQLLVAGLAVFQVGAWWAARSRPTHPGVRGGGPLQRADEARTWRNAP